MQVWDAEVPSIGDNVWIRPGYNVMLDVSPPRLNRLVIEGVLHFNHTDITLEAVRLIDIHCVL